MLPSPWRAGWLSAGLPLLGLSIVLAACGGKAAQPPALADSSLRPDAQAEIIVPAGKPIVIGLSLPLSGPDASAGEEDRDAVITAVNRWKEQHGDTIAGHEIVVHAEDDGCTEAGITLQAAERLLRTEGLVGVVGPNCSAGAEAAIPVYRGAGIVAISGSVTRTDLTVGQGELGFFFRTAYRNDLQGTLVGLFVRFMLQAEKMWVVDDSEAYGEDLANAIQNEAESVGVEVARESVKRGAVDFSDLAARITEDNPDFVGFAGFNPEAALLYRQLRDAGYTGPYGSGDAASSKLDFIDPVGADAAEGVVFAGCALTLPNDFAADYIEVHGGPPQSSSFTPQYADAVTMLLNAVAAAAQEHGDGSLTIDPGALRDSVADKPLSGGVSGNFAFDDNGDRVPHPGENLEKLVEAAAAAADIGVYLDLGLVPCQVQDGRLVNLLGPGSGTYR